MREFRAERYCQIVLEPPTLTEKINIFRRDDPFCKIINSKEGFSNPGGWSWIWSNSNSVLEMVPFLHERLPSHARIYVLTATSSKWDLTEQSEAKSGRTESQASYSRCVHRLWWVLSTSVLSARVLIAEQCVEGFVLYLMVDKGAEVALYHWHALCQGPYFPSVLSSVRCAEQRTWEQNVSLRCRQPLAVLASSAFMESKKEVMKEARPSITDPAARGCKRAAEAS